jgi:CBS domain-containing protein
VGQFLTAFHCASPMFPNDFNHVVSVRQSATVTDVLKKLHSQKVQAVVVCSDKTGIPIYTVSVMDIVGFIVQKVKPEELTHGVWDQLAHFMSGEEGDEPHPLAKTTLLELERDQEYDLDACFALMKDQPLLDAVKLMLEHSVHRVVVYEDDKTFKLNNLITQSRVMAFLNTIVDQVPAAKKTLAQAGLANGGGGSKILHTVASTSPAFLAFKTMQEFKVSAIPVVHPDGTMEGSISATDIKLVGFDMAFWKDLGLPCSEFLAKISNHPGYQAATPIMAHIKKTMWSDALAPHTNFICCDQDTTVEEAVNILVAHKVHRVWIVEDAAAEKKKPTGVVSLIDVLRILVE